jgi:hypothetical protein
MYNLEEEIARWRQRMAAGGIKAPAVLDELEGHLREEVRVQMADGAAEQEAFKMAAVRIGSATSVGAEFDKLKGATSLPVLIAVSAWAVFAVFMVCLVLIQIAKGKADALLGAHVFTITTGFLGAFVVGSLGVCYLCWQLFGTLSFERSSAVRKAVSVSTRISLAFMAVGFLLGMLWASQHRGGYWLGSLVEIGSLCTVLWLAALTLIQRNREVDEHSLMFSCAASNVVAALGWFGMVILTADPQLTTHFLNYWPLEIFVIVHLLFLAMSFGRGLKPAES